MNAESVVSSLLSTLTGGMNYDGIPLSELPENARIVEQTVGNPAMAEQLNNLLNQHDDPELPKAHLNYLVFNDEMQLVPQESGAVQVGLSAANGQVTVTQAGYILVYIDNQSIGNDVWFDNVHLEHYTGQVLEEDMYYPFGLTLSQDAGVVNTAQPYKYNSKELQTEFGLQYYDYGARMYNSQIGRWNGIDPLAEKFRHESPFNYAGNNPVINIDVEGQYKLSSKTRNQSKILAAYLDNYIQNDVAKSPTLINTLKKYGQFKDWNSIKSVLTKNNGPTIVISDDIPFGADGYYSGGTNGTIEISSKLIQNLNSAKTSEEKEIALLQVISILLHETVHYGDWQDGDPNDNQDVTRKTVTTANGEKIKVDRWLKKEGPGDKGHYFETDAYNNGNDDKGPIDNSKDAQMVIDRQKENGDKEHILPTVPKLKNK
ncbi:MAG TPA: RHS repeat-associated core domain-containing protein [Edaphocola sp.]|nr:RHS repeat-associated core domain-containing protein [Edaphocola sp.]